MMNSKVVGAALGIVLALSVVAGLTLTQGGVLTGNTDKSTTPKTQSEALQYEASALVQNSTCLIDVRSSISDSHIVQWSTTPDGRSGALDVTIAAGGVGHVTFPANTTIPNWQYNITLTTALGNSFTFSKTLC